MKRRIISLFVFMLCALPLFTVPIKRVLVGSGNDMWTEGFSRNDDDQLSYSLFTLLDFDELELSLELAGITNRGYKNGWMPGKSIPSENQFYSGRIDNALLKACKTSIYNNKSLALSFKLELGALLAGNIGLDKLQNGSHDSLKVHSVNLEYDTNSIFPYPYLGAEFGLGLNLLSFGFSNLYLSLFANGNSAINLNHSSSIGGGFHITRSGKSIIGIEISKTRTISDSSFPTQKLFEAYENGARLFHFIDTGLLYLSHEAFTTTGYGFTRVAMNLLPNESGFEFISSDLNVSLGVSYFLENDLWTIRLSKPFKRQPLSLFIENRNISGYPVDSQAELSSDLSLVGRTKKAYNMWLFGAQYSIDLKYIEAYSALSIGFGQFKIYKLLNSIPGSSIPFVNLEEILAFTSDFSVGVILLPQDLIINGYSSYRVRIEAGCTFVYGDGLEGLFKSYDEKAYEKLGVFNPKLTVMLEIGMDL